MEAGLAAPDNNRKPPVPRDTTHGNTGCLGFAGQQWPALTCVHHEPVEPACRQEGVQEDEGLGTETDEVTGFGRRVLAARLMALATIFGSLIMLPLYCLRIPSAVFFACAS